jgi:hypothetical protein
VASLVLHIAFLVIETRVTQPLVPLGRVANRTVGLANVVAFLLLVSFFSLIFIGTLFMQQVLGYSALEAGLAWLTVSVPALVAAATTGAVLVERIGVRPILVAGLTILTVALFGLSQLDAASTFASGLLPWFILSGLGIGLCFPAAQVAAHWLDERQRVSPGLVNTSQEVGGAVSGVLALSHRGHGRRGRHRHGPGRRPRRRVRAGVPHRRVHRDRRHRDGAAAAPRPPRSGRRARWRGGPGDRGRDRRRGHVGGVTA